MELLLGALGILAAIVIMWMFWYTDEDRYEHPTKEQIEKWHRGEN